MRSARVWSADPSNRRLTRRNWWGASFLPVGFDVVAPSVLALRSTCRVVVSEDVRRVTDRATALQAMPT